jgi:hypothetical protein
VPSATGIARDVLDAPTMRTAHGKIQGKKFVLPQISTLTKKQRRKGVNIAGQPTV